MRIQFHREEAEAVSEDAVFEYLRTPEASAVTDVSFQETATDDTVTFLCQVLLEQHAHLNVRSLRLSRNGLTQVTALASLLETNQTITDLDLSHNALGDHSLPFLLEPLHSANTILKSLNLEDNHFRSANAVSVVLRRSQTLQRLVLSRNPLGPRGIKDLAHELSHNNTLTSLSLSHAQLGPRGMLHLANGMENPNHSIQFLDLTYNHMGDRGMQHLSTLLLFDRTIQRVWLTGNDLGPWGAFNLAPCLRFNTTLTELRLGCNQIGNEGCQSITNALLRNPTMPLQLLKLNSNLIGDEGATELAQVVRQHATLTELDLHGNVIGREGGIALAQALPYSGSLRVLDVSCNALCDDVAEALSETLVGGNRVLETLEYRENQFSEVGETQLFGALRYRRNYRRWLDSYLDRVRRLGDSTTNVNLLAREIGDDEIVKVAHVLGQAQPQRLSAIYLGGESITTRGISSLTTQCLDPPTRFPRLVRLYLRNSSMGDAGAVALSRAIPSTPLAAVTLASSAITSAGARALARCLSESPSLVRLNLDRNMIGDQGLQALIGALQEEPNTSLRSLSVADNGITDNGIEGVASTCLEELHLEDNRITNQGALRLAEELADHNPLLEWLSLQGNQVTEEGGEAIRLLLPPTAVFAYK